MKLHKSLHSHIRKHHSKYIGGITLGGLYFVTFKLILSTIGMIGLFDSIVGVFAHTAGEINITRDFGSGFNNVVRKIDVQSDGKLIIAGNFTNYNGVGLNRVVRFTDNLLLDPSFDTSVVIGEILGMSISSDDKILLGGNIHVTRLNADGTKDLGFNVSYINGTVRDVLCLSGGKSTAVGWFDPYANSFDSYGIAWIDTDGSLNPLLGNTNVFDVGYPYVLKTYGENKFLAGGTFSSYKSEPINKLILLNTDGSRDTDFNIGSGFNNTVASLEVQSDGKILVGGFFTNYSGEVANRLIRLNTDGSIDTGFNIGSGFDNGVWAISQQSDGKILVGGSFTNYSGEVANRLIRLNADGSRDESFNIGSGFNSTVYAIHQHGTGEIIIGGNFTNYNGYSTNRIVSLYSNSAIASLPSKVNLYSPITHEFLSTGNVHFSWDSAIDAGSLISGYTYELSTGGLFENILIYEFVNETGVLLTGLYDNTYYRRVYASNVDGNTGDYSDISVFTIDTIVPTIQGITNGSQYTTSVTFSATDVNGISGVTLDGNNLQSWVNYTITAVGVHTLIVRDISGNSATVTFEVRSPTPTGGGGGGLSLVKDKCAKGDYTSSYYDKQCGEKITTTGFINKNIKHGSAESATGLMDKVVEMIKTTITNIIDNIKIPEKEEIKQSIANHKNEKTKEELAESYQFALEKGITTVVKVEDIELDGILTREQMAKMVSNYVINVMGITGTKYGEKECGRFSDLGTMSKEMKSYAIVSCQLGLMGQDSKGGFLNKFNPKAEVTRGQFGTILSRMLRGSKYNRDGGDWYKSHLYMLKDNGIMDNILDPSAKELRGRVMVMMKRASEKYLGK